MFFAKKNTDTQIDQSGKEAKVNANPNAGKIEAQTYLSVRIRELKAELTSLQAEKKAVVEKLKAMTDRTSAEAKELKKRRVYLNKRPIDVKVELREAVDKRKSLVEKAPAGSPFDVEKMKTAALG